MGSGNSGIGGGGSIGNGGLFKAQFVTEYSMSAGEIIAEMKVMNRV